MVRLNHAVAVGMAVGPKEGLALLEPLDSDGRMKDHHRLEAVRAHLLEMSGDLDGARASYLLAARRTTSMPERDYLQKRADRISS
jgi:predicted RNA polymerase sigma factor